MCKQNIELERKQGYIIPYDIFLLYEIALFAVFIQARIAGSNSILLSLPFLPNHPYQLVFL